MTTRVASGAVPVRVLHVAAEIFPWVKAGGLGDVMAALPAAIARTGADVRLLLPGLPAVLGALRDRTPVLSVGPQFGVASIDVVSGTLQGLPAYAIDAPKLFDRPGSPYLGADGRDWPDNHLRFGLLGGVAARLAAGEIDRDWCCDVLHAHDWHAGLAAAYLEAARASQPVRRVASVFTIHNLAYQGLFPAEAMAALQLPSSFFSTEGLEFYGKLSFMKAALFYSDRITTVSPTYAREIQEQEFGCGLDGLLRRRASEVLGILNGVDTAVWDPASDAALAHHYTAGDLGGKARLKAALQAEFGLAARPDAPLFCVVSRLTQQKGLDLLLGALPTLHQIGAQLVVLASGDALLERGFSAAASADPDAVAVRLGFDETLSHRIIAGADVIVVPSRFEPCGLTQLYGLRYGTLPLVRRVGGLADSVVDASAPAIDRDEATGFAFDEATPAALAAALQRVAGVWKDRMLWVKLMRRAMAQDFSWRKPAEQYLRLYQSLRTSATSPPPSGQPVHRG